MYSHYFHLVENKLIICNYEYVLEVRTIEGKNHFQNIFNLSIP